MINLTKPTDPEQDKELEKALTAFEKAFKRQDKSRSSFNLIIPGELSRALCDRVEELYSTVGWKIVKCKTSSENGEPFGLTMLTLSKI